ncbi:MAG: hypothetical protein AAF533_08830 [Acidobacteriota bacterium]
MVRTLVCLLVAQLLTAGACVTAQTLPDDIDISVTPNGIVPLPDTVGPVFTDLFDRYTKITAPNGGAIHFLLQDRVTDEMAVRAREIMRFYLTDAPGTVHGADKTAVANSMADLDATLVYFNTEADSFRAIEGPLGSTPLFFQDLYAEESVVEGSAEYVANTNRDATLEEVFHLVHGAGIEPTLPTHHAEITAATNAAMAAGLWIPPPDLPAADRPFEYIISIIDVQYGLWAHDPTRDGTSFYGEYAFNTPAAMAAGDPAGLTAMLAFLPPVFSFDCRVAAELTGRFDCHAPEPSEEYVLKSRHLTRVRLTGSNDSDLTGNDWDNVLGGNSGDNDIECKGGTDTVVFTGPWAEYVITVDGSTTVEDTVPGRDGIDVVDADCELLRFADRTVGPAPPAVPPTMRVAKLEPTGTTLSLSWDDVACAGAVDHVLVHGGGSQLPTTASGTFEVGGGLCALGATSPFVWEGSVDASSDPTGLAWWLLVATDGASVEGSWGLDGAGVERLGPVPSGASGLCGATERDLSNSCGR